MNAPFFGKRIVVFTAHPDDEGLAAGTMYENHRAGGETFLFCATYGEKGKSHLKKPVTDAALKKIRKAELLSAAKVLHIDHVIFLGLPDAGVKEHVSELYKKSLPLIKKIKPYAILGFGPDGVSAHWDHITAGKVALRIARALKTPFYAFTLGPQAIRLRARGDFFLKRRKFGRYAGIPSHRQGDVKIKVDMAIKRRAMKHHRSQFPSGTPFAALPKRMASAMFRYEHFVKEKM